MRRKFRNTETNRQGITENTTNIKTPLTDKEMDKTEKQYPFADPSEEFISNVNQVIRELMERKEGDVEHVASKLCITPYQLRGKLTAITGITPKKYILGVRLECARQMLAENPERTIADVGESCGFYDKSHFTRTFRETFNMTPNDYVKQIRKS